jgi:hypothetical protein
MINNISYADDMALLSPLVAALREMLRVCEQYANKHRLKYNCQKNEIVMFAACSSFNKYVPPIWLNGELLNIVSI